MIRREDKMVKRMVEVLVGGRFHGSIVVWVYRSWSADRVAQRAALQVDNYCLLHEIDPSTVDSVLVPLGWETVDTSVD